MSYSIASLSFFLLVTAPAHAAKVDHSAWDGLWHQYVKDGLVDYEGLKSQQAVLDGYLAELKKVIPTQLESPEAQLAFWINAYNAFVIQDVLARYPLQSVRSVKGFFDSITHPIAGGAYTLNQFEERGRALGDWRIHCAVVCASSSCPLLRSEAYVPERLIEYDWTLNDQARARTHP